MKISFPLDIKRLILNHYNSKVDTDDKQKSILTLIKLCFLH